MACGMKYLGWLSETGRLPPRGRLLDIGESCLLGATAEELETLARRHGCSLPDEQLKPLLDVFATRSNTIGNPELPTLFLSELLELTEIEYVAFDVVAARKCERFDLNVHRVAESHRGTFDLVLNFGTTEHLVNQFNAFRVMHDAVRPGGFIFSQVPSTGFLSHGYFCYTPLMFRELAAANGYELVELWFTGPMGAGHPVVNSDPHPGIFDATKPHNNVAAHKVTAIPDNVINVLYRKPAAVPGAANAEFLLGLEVSTAAGVLNRSAAYTSPYIHVDRPAPPQPAEPPPPARSFLKRVLGKVGLGKRAA
ncbi:MAG TPA: methyltransferase domain-containing protein [Gemmataceae bacterium]|nr:methyltransferase domain-containing protein [Gemmataceae bacterium]